MTDLYQSWLEYGQQLNTLFMWIGAIVFAVVALLSMGVKFTLTGIRWAVRVGLSVLVIGLLLLAVLEWPF